MAFLSEDMKAQLMKIVGVNKDEINTLLKEHAPDLSKCQDQLAKTSPFELQHVLFRSQLEDQGLEELKEKKDIGDKLSHIYQVLLRDSDFRNVRGILPGKKSLKDDQESRKYKELGNSAFQKRDFNEAIGHYNKAIQYGRLDGKEVSLALGNRSVVFFNLKQFKDCLQDCQAALMFGYPEELQYKVLERQGRCQMQLGECKKAGESFNEAISKIEKSKLTGEARLKVVQQLEDIIRELPRHKVAAVEDPRPDLPHLKLLTTHCQFPSMSSSVEMRYNPQVGRHAVSTAKIRPGEVILMESPLVWNINPEQTLKTCVRCLKQAGNHMVPCRTRENAVFCSLACFLQSTADQAPTADTLPTAFEEEDFRHRISDLFSASREKSATILLALWSVKSKPLEFFVSREEELFAQLKPDFGVNEDQGWRLEGQDQLYKSLYNLVSHMSTMTWELEFNTLINTAVLLRFLQEFGYFPEPSQSHELTPAERLIGRLLFQFQCGIRYNQHGVYQAEKKVEVGKTLPLVDTGSAVYPTLLFLNHSCAPNTLRVNDGKTMYVVAKTEILPGEEITDCYGIHHLSIDREERRERLSRGFKFVCICPACDQDWPLFPQLESSLTQSEMGRLGNHLSMYQKEFKAGQYAAACTRCQTYLEKLAEINVDQPHRNYEVGGMALSSCFWAPLLENTAA